jgi:PAS domain S-box-containing protein
MDPTQSPTRTPSRLAPPGTKAAGASRPAAEVKDATGLTPTQLRAAFDRALDAILVADDDGRYVDANPAASALLGIPREEILARSVRDFVHPDFDFESAWAEFLRAGQARGEMPLCLPDGRIRAVEFVATASIAPGRHLSILRDVTDRKEAESDLRLKQEELRDFVENAPVGLHWVGPDGTILWANQAELEMLGYGPEEYIGRHISDFHAPPDVIEDILHRLRAGETLRQHEARLRCKDGSIKLVQISSNVKWENGRFVHTRCFTRDVTDRRKSQEAIVEAQRQLSMALTAARMGTWSWNVQTGALDWSDNLEEIHGMAPGTFGGTFESFLGCIHPEDRAMVEEGVRRAVSERSTYDVEFRVPFFDGSTHWVAGYGQVFVDAEGNPTRMIGIGRDVTEKRRAEEALEKAYEDAREALEIRDAFLSVAGHEFRTPLGALSLTLHNLARRIEGDPDDSATRSIQNLRRQVDRLTRLTEDLLEVGRIRAGKLILEPEPVDLTVLVREIVDRFRESASAAGSNIETAPADSVTGTWDASRLDQVFSNLLANAVKFGSGEPIEVRVERRAETAVVSIRDRGIGISAEDQTRIFERFERANSAKSYRGIGLGLWIARQIVEGHGGEIRLDSEPGKGSTFTVVLPGVEKA